MPKDESTTKFKADISDLKANIQEAGRQIRLANSEFKAATAGMDKWSESADGISAKLKQLNDVLGGEKKKLESLVSQYELVVKEQGENFRGAEELKIKINNQRAVIGDTEKQIRQYNDRLGDMEKGTEDVKEETQKSTEGFTVLKGALADLVASGIKAAIGALKDMADTAKEAYSEFDTGYDNLIKATGATGDTAKELEKSYSAVAKTVNGDLGTIGSALGEVNTRFGYTGEELEDATTLFMKFADITGTDATQAVQLVSRAMGDAGIDSSKYGEVLDELAVAAQASGISVNKLTELLTKYGAPMRALGFDTQESIAIFSQWEKAGVNTEVAFSGMKTAISNWSKEGKDAKVEFRKTLDEIAAAPDIASATTEAIEVFGKKAGPDLADAIQGGRFEYSDFLALIESSAGTVTATYEQTQDGFDKIELAAQGLKTGVGEAVKGLLNEYGPEIDAFIEKVQTFLNDALSYITETLIPSIKDFFEWAKEHLPEIEALVAGIAAAFIGWKVASIISAITTALAGMSAAEAVAAAKTWLLNTALLANPIGLLIALLAGLVAAFVVLWKKCDWFRESWIRFGTAIRNAAEKTATAVKNFFADALTKIKQAWSGAGEFFGTVWESIKSAFSGVVKWWADLFAKAYNAATAAWNGAGNFFKNVWNNIKSAFGGTVKWWANLFAQAYTAATTEWDGAGEYFAEVWEGIKDVFSDVVAFWSGKFSAAWGEVKVAWDNAEDFFDDVWYGIKSTFSDVGKYFRSVFADAWSEITNAFSSVGSFFEGIWDTVSGIFADIGTTVGEAIGGTFKRLINDVLDKVENTVNYLPNTVNPILQTLTDISGHIFSYLPTINLPRLAKGGVVNRSILANIGEDGAEAIVPLERNTQWLDEVAKRLSMSLSGGVAYAHAGVGAPITKNVTNNFYQTNNSPKALNRLEIYRQSRNLLSMRR